jgi:hypothetical protein
VQEMAQEAETPAAPQPHTVSRMVFVPPIGE